MHLLRWCSQCYQIENFNQDVLIKANAIELLQHELVGNALIGTISAQAP